METSKYRRLLLEISNNMTDSELKSMKFMLIDRIPRSRMEDLIRATDVFTEMENREMLSPERDKLTYLRGILSDISEGRKNLTALIDRETGGADDERQPVHQELREDIQAKKLKDEINYLAKNLGRQWRQMCRQLPEISEADIDDAKEKHERDLREQALYVLNLWRKRNQNCSKKDLIEACRKAEMNLYADELEESHFDL